jgi:hypothetical protein
MVILRYTETATKEVFVEAERSGDTCQRRMYPISTKVDGFSETERLWDSGFEAGLSHHEPISKASQAALETSRASVAIDGWRSPYVFPT